LNFHCLKNLGKAKEDNLDGEIFVDRKIYVFSEGKLQSSILANN